MSEMKQTWTAMLSEFQEKAMLKKNQLLVLGCSTSEVAGRHIGTSGSEGIAEDIYSGLYELQQNTGIRLAFQCCEHLNRALVVEEETAELYRLPAVSAVPVPKAGGAMASYAFKQMASPVLVETIQADAGIDVGDTFIGMHLKPVAVPIRISKNQLGAAHVTLARSRPKLIGGVRAVYECE
ncbi:MULTISPECIES: TIGR01440 family protein [Bacillus]|uniref:TIGR01440 family protein n=1 Tax=Bacillus TaxID=1386 RepID=UPI000D033587|nr:MULTISPECIES: TIGR01440 family protein [Bacillus]MBT2625065.1 TIGR01440 family protein [Bacillus sp. ISL-32]MCI3195481.1 TIGR01440 family protein [Bacillus sp. HU-1818]MCY8513043.1 TIGR01440 family protein [Bacillus atrophaeus]MCY8516908.1 TIGR01440 family protein [Bacillus atrophaeus]MCY8992369.1 TIGR01440 family protein [Bacillus atrophaeus]